jgi:hypothetical protein
VSNISRAVIDAIMPKGSAWFPAVGKGLDLFLDGSADNIEIIKNALNDLSTIQIAELTQYIEDLEKEYGLLFDASLSEATRRNRIKNAKTDNQGYGTDWDMQAKLRRAGFDNIFVYQNDPTIDINQFLGNTANVTCGDPEATCGNPGATCSSTGGLLVVNGDIFFNQSTFFYKVPTQEYWDNVFFVGGEATFGLVERADVTCGNPSSTCGNPSATCGSKFERSEITDIEEAEISSGRRDELIRLIVKYKPIHSWAALRVNFT